MPKFFKYNGMEKTEITDVDSVCLILDNGMKFELTYRKSDGEVSLDCDPGSLIIVPKAPNVVRLRGE